MAQAINAGVHITASAGNSASLSSTQSPARAEAIITVGAANILDAKSSYSNYGPGVDIFAPGDNILSSYIGSSSNATEVLSGTSMSTPHVVRLLSLLKLVIARVVLKVCVGGLGSVPDWARGQQAPS